MKTSFGKPQAGASAPAPTRPPPPPRRGATPPAPAAPGRQAPGRRAPVAAAPPAPAPVAPPVVEAPVTVMPPETTATTTAVAVPGRRTRRTKAEMAAASAATGTTTTEPIAPGQTTTLAVTGATTGTGFGQLPIGAIEGAVEASDLSLPQVKIANAVGPLSLLNPPVPPGTIVVGSNDQWLYLWQQWQETNQTTRQLETFTSEPVGITILRAKKQFGQVTNEKGESLYDIEGAQGLTFDTKEEMAEAGGMLGTPVAGMLGFEAQLTCHVLVRMPEGLEDDLGLFNIEHADGLFMQAMWYIRGSSYNECARKIFTEKTQFLADGSHTAEFLMEGKLIKGKRNSWWIPMLVNGEQHTQELVDYLTQNA